MSCNFLGDDCSESSPCCDGFQCNNSGLCDFYRYNSTKGCPRGYSKMAGGLCGVDSNAYSPMFLTFTIILVILIVIIFVSIIIWRLIILRRRRS